MRKTFQGAQRLFSLQFLSSEDRFVCLQTFSESREIYFGENSLRELQE
jgi:hypothetical protein